MDPRLESTRKASPSSLKGFGEHVDRINYNNYQQAKSIAYVALAILGLTIVASSLVAVSIFVPIFPIFFIPATTWIASSITISSVGLISVFSLIHLKQQKTAYFGAMNEVNSQINSEPTKLGEYSNCQVLACQDTEKSFNWKKKLIEESEENIVLSGNYCGGDSFDEILNLLHKQLQTKPKLKVVVLSSDRFITNENRTLLANLNTDFEERFQLIETRDIWHTNPRLTRTTNHSKFLIIDYGKAYLLGGSGIEDKYAYTEGLGDKSKRKAKKEKNLLNKLMADNFRDQDFVFASLSKDGIGRRIYIESLELSIKWEDMNKSPSFSTDNKTRDHISHSHSVAKCLLTEETTALVENRSFSPRDLSKTPDFTEAETTALCMGPEHTKNPFEQELVERFQQANKRIVIDHMYFHPTEKILTALEQAARRGVEITIVTNGLNKKSPIGHTVFVPRNRYNYYLLASRLGPDFKDKLKVYEFTIENTTLHKKVIVVDDYVIAGSSNLGYKSLVTMSDHEINFITKSQKLADETIKIINIDMSHKTSQCQDDLTRKLHPTYSKLISDPEKRPDFSTLIIAALHRIHAPLIG